MIAYLKGVEQHTKLQVPNMWFALLICVLIPGCIGTNSVFVRINGTLTCSAQFEYAIELVEADTISDDLIDFTDFRTSKGSVENYEVHGWETESEFFNNAIEPWMRIYHTCGTKSGCVCKKWDNIYSHTEITLNINLDKNDVMCGDLCASPDSVADLRGHSLSKKMKLALLICVLIPGCLGMSSIFVRIDGTLTCSTPFEYAVELVEDDPVENDKIDFTRFRRTKGTVEHYDVHGWCKEGEPLNNAVEPWIRIYHNCGTNSGCVCKKWENIYDDTEITVDIDLNGNISDVQCDLCASPDTIENIKYSWDNRHGKHGKWSFLRRK
ncbi:hypothetical protein PRIPAC_93385 [Pristionchus pacificus]|uniref:Uncharacterized protein n=1 Tax=Pristionchus pacificus TaxID=54126 RepID=A0A2A6BQU8_PRIPA|nr:hypothetical protein PRIPAC_93385 [Pristionchus pacificus]|eukprot:PDM68294.1 hypothetical protein PRIPAC_46338 [Pristionchus pacificus]